MKKLLCIMYAQKVLSIFCNESYIKINKTLGDKVVDLEVLTYKFRQLFKLQVFILESYTTLYTDTL